MKKQIYSSRPLARGLPVAIQKPARMGLIYARMMSVTKDDLLLAAYPKSGGTWFRFLLASALTGEEMSYDRVQIFCPPLGSHRRAPTFQPRFDRMIKTHERPIFVRTPARTIYLLRDGRDVAVSYYHHMQSLGYSLGEFPGYLSDFLDGNVGPYGSWQDHVISWTEHCRAHSATSVVLRYEDLLADPAGQLARVSEFFDLDVDEARIEQAVAMSSAARMRAKEATSELLTSKLKFTGQFVRSARAGGWKATFTATHRQSFVERAGAALTLAGYDVDASH